MQLAIITDSTCDLDEATLQELQVTRVPLYVNFKGKMHKDWIEITPKDIIEGVKAGASIPSTSQPSPQDFAKVFEEAAAAGAKEILCITISSGLSGTYQSATVAREDAPVPVTVFDTQAASIGIGMMVQRAAQMRDEGAALDTIMTELERIRKTSLLRFTVASLDFLQKNGRIGRASALLGSLLNVKPILGVSEGKVVPTGRARGAKKALKEMVEQVAAFAKEHGSRPIVYFLHVQDPAAADTLRQELRTTGTDFHDGGTFEIGAVIATHVGPGTYGMYLYTEG